MNFVANFSPKEDCMHNMQTTDTRSEEEEGEMIGSKYSRMT
jgi:hypothetical protein